MDKEIKFKAVYRGKRSQFVIDPVSGAGGLCHLYIDHFYYGQFFVLGGDWVFRPQNDDTFTPEQIEILLDQLRKRHPPG